MTGLEFLICTSALASIVAQDSTNHTPEYHHAVARNVCAAANVEAFDPMTLAALIMGENGKFEVNATMPASAGVDQGLCQLNSAHQRDRLHGKNAYHPYDCTRIAASILRSFQDKYGPSWIVISSYWNPSQALRQTNDAKAYYNRWAVNYRRVQARFSQARNSFSPTSGSP